MGWLEQARVARCRNRGIALGAMLGTKNFISYLRGALYIPIIGKGCHYYYWVDMTINWDDEGQSLSETFYFLRRTLGHMNADEILDEHLKLSIWTQRIDSSLAFGLKRWQM